MTNADRIRNMNDEELHNFLKKISEKPAIFADEYCVHCPRESECEAHGDGCLCQEEGKTDSIWLWMGMETK